MVFQYFSLYSICSHTRFYAFIIFCHNMQWRQWDAVIFLGLWQFSTCAKLQEICILWSLVGEFWRYKVPILDNSKVQYNKTKATKITDQSYLILSTAFHLLMYTEFLLLKGILILAFAKLVLNSWIPEFSGFSWLHNFTGGQLQINVQSSEGNSFSLYVLTLCSAANMCNFVRFFHSSTA